MSSVKFTVEINVKEDFVQVFEPFAQAMHKLTHEFDKGIIQYDLYAHKNDKRKFYFIEEWEDQAALDAHESKDHFKKFIEFVDDTVDTVNRIDEKIDTTDLVKYEEMI